jgi:hypothetical protein
MGVPPPLARVGIRPGLFFERSLSRWFRYAQGEDRPRERPYRSQRGAAQRLNGRMLGFRPFWIGR